MFQSKAQAFLIFVELTLFKKSGLVNPNYKLYFYPPAPAKITTHGDDFDIERYIAEATAHYGRSQGR